MIRSRFAFVLGGVLIVGLMASGRLASRAADPEPATKTSPEEMKPGDGAKLGLPTSPLNWPPGRTIFEESAAEQKIREALQQTTEIAFNDTQLGDVVEFLEKRHEINIELDTEALAADGKGSETPITKSLREVTLHKALRLILDGQGLTYLVKNDVMLITTKAAASQPENQMVRLYQVHDLVVAPNDPTASQPDFDSLIELLTSCIRQNDWADNGGTIGMVKQFQGPGVIAIFVTHDDRGHEEVEQMLKSLRAAKVQAIYDAQAMQPLKPRPQYGYGVMGTAGFDVAALLQHLQTLTTSTAPPTAQPAGTVTEQKKAVTPAQSGGGGFF
jgi:hypothetical protein